MALLKITEMLNHNELTKFLEYKQGCQNISAGELAAIENYIDSKSYIKICEMIKHGTFPGQPSRKSIISKEGSTKKRVVYSFEDDINITLKFIAHSLYQYDYLFSPCCYAFRKNYGVGDAIRRIRKHPEFVNKYCLKVDISNYFNSIDVDILLKKLDIIRESDDELYQIFYNILTEKYTIHCGRLIEENRGAMAGIPVSPFFANLYMASVDKYFYENNIEYFRYSDDIIILASSDCELANLQDTLYKKIYDLNLHINHEKECISKPGEVWEFLGFSYKFGEIDLSDNTVRKLKGKIRRKAHALRRWQRKKGLSEEMAAKGFINAINRKLYGKNNNEVSGDSDFTWSRWFFPNITTAESLSILDDYIQEYIRFTITGRHYKGNYRIPYSKLKEFGYRSLVHEYFKRN